MVAAAVKGKSNSLSDRLMKDASKPIETGALGGVPTFKIFAEPHVKLKNKGNSLPSHCKKYSIGGGKSESSTSAFKSGVKNLEKNKSKHDNPVKANIGRKVLADISNVKGSFSRTRTQDRTKSLCSSRNSVVGTQTGSSSKKSITGNMRKNTSQSSGSHHTMKMASYKDKKATSDDPRTKTQGHKVVNSTSSRTYNRNPLPPTRKSFPVIEQVHKVTMSDSKEESTERSEKCRGNYGFPVNSKVGRVVASRVSSSRSQPWKNRVSDGYLEMDSKGQQMTDIRTLSRRSVKETSQPRATLGQGKENSVKFMNDCTILCIADSFSDSLNCYLYISLSLQKPILKSKNTAFKIERTSNSKGVYGFDKPAAISAVSTKRKEEKAKVPSTKHVAPVFPSGQEEVSSTSNSSSDRITAANVARRKSDRRKSFTSLLMSGSKEDLPKIYDDGNHLEVTEYVDEIYQYYWVMEAQNQPLQHYMEIQTEITPQMRGVLINWLIEVHLKFDLMQETLFLMVTLLDQYLSLVSIKKNKMQLVGLTALLLASKYEDFWHPRIMDLVSISADSYTRDEMLGMENSFLKTLKFRLNAPTPYVFMLRFNKAAQSDNKFEHLAFYLIELCLVEYEALKYKPSLLCASAIYLARCTMQISPTWTPLLRKHSRYEESQIRHGAEMILKFHKAAKTAMLKVTYEKYMRPELSRVAAINPLDVLPQS